MAGYNHFAMCPTPDTAQPTSWLIVPVAPAVGQGNPTEAKIVAHHINTHSAQELAVSPKLQATPAQIFRFALTGAAQWKHSHISDSAARSITYAEHNGKERNSWIAERLKEKMAFLVKYHVKNLLKQHHLANPQSHPEVAVISPQDMTIEGLVKNPKTFELIKALFLICPDVFGKFDPTKTEINEKIVHLFWNAEAYAAALTALPAEKVKLIIPPDPLEAFPTKPEKALASPGSTLIKLSGSGSDDSVITAMAVQLKTQGLNPLVVCETESQLKTIQKKAIPTETDPGWFYHSLAAAQAEQPPFLICYPSEQVKHLIVLQQKGIFIPTVFLYPKGLHEARNLAWAIKQGLSKVVCVPKTLPDLPDPQAEVAKLLLAQGVTAAEYQMLDPSELTREHFVKPTQAWEQPPQAISLFNAVRTVLTGKQPLVSQTVVDS